MSKACSTWPVVVFFLSTVFFLLLLFFPPFQGNPRQVWRGGTQMRRSENRGEPRETFASNSRDSQDFEIFFFLSFFLLSPSLPLLLLVSSHSSEHPHLRSRAFFTSVSRPFISIPRLLSSILVPPSMGKFEMAKRLPFFPRAWFTDLSCFSRLFLFTLVNLGEI